MAEAGIERVIPEAIAGPDKFEKFLGAGALVMLVAICTAVLRGVPDWGRVPLVVWAHLATITIAVGMTPDILWQRRGTARHRTLGYVWVAAMAVTALDSLFIRINHHGSFSIIHLLSIWTLIQVPLIVIFARRHDAMRHRRAVRGMVLGALLIAGFFTFPFNRLLGQWLFG
ncbi:MAG: hypothetical protein NTX28_12475 [Novosphingobium sp.]|nr:hypothetical protein [Novosphingobium sp.]